MRSTAAVILAAGESVRLGQPKQFLNFRGKSLLRAAADSAHDAGCAPIVVVVAVIEPSVPATIAMRRGIERALGGSETLVVENPESRRGIGTSIRAGVRAVAGSDVGSVVLMACDQPLVDASTIALLWARREQTGKPIIASAYANTVGVPALFDRSCFEALINLPDGEGAKELITANLERVGQITFPKGCVDIDLPADWEKLNISQ